MHEHDLRWAREIDSRNVESDMLRTLAWEVGRALSTDEALALELRLLES